MDGTGKPQPLTHTALTMGCAASDGWLVWTLHIDPDIKPQPSDGILDDPYEVKSSQLPVTDDDLVHRGYLPMGAPIAGAGFSVLPAGGTALSVQALSSNDHFRLSGGVDQLTVAAGNGDRLVYASYKGRVATVHVARFITS